MAEKKVSFQGVSDLMKENKAKLEQIEKIMGDKPRAPPAGKNPNNPANPSPSDYWKAARHRNSHGSS